MFNTIAYAAVDAVQNSKKTFVETFVKHEGMAKTLTNFVDGQTAYTKAAIDAGLTFATNVGTLITTKSFYDEMAESMTSLVPSFSTKKGK